ncbi:MAG: hypothetical protein HQL14_06105 [Candidatus Omnitrophica bacterium]|nr:hypothetical protein [Candidatus Omnitrophota bacterium]
MTLLKILFFILWFLPAFKIQADTPVEIYVNGDKYDSMQAYKASKDQPSSPGFLPKPVMLNSQQEDFILNQAKKLGVKVEISKVKTLQMTEDFLSEPTGNEMYVLSVEKGVVGALKDFYKTLGASPDYHLGSTLLESTYITPDQMEEAIKQAVTLSAAPKFLISQPGKVRILTLSADDTQKEVDY